MREQVNNTAQKMAGAWLCSVRELWWEVTHANRSCVTAIALTVTAELGVMMSSALQNFLIQVMSNRFSIENHGSKTGSITGHWKKPSLKAGGLSHLEV